MSRVVEIGASVSSTEESRASAASSISRRDRLRSWQNGILCALAVVVCWLVAWPFANMPFMDDFSYVKTALEFARTGHFVYNGWATAMLGWQIPWGALFIKLFGFSFNVMRISMLPIAMATVLVFHQVLRRFGLSPANAVLGALTLGLSPLFLPLAASFMTDILGLFVIIICIYMCQRAVAAETDGSALLWLIAVTLVNLVGGSVRQIAWLGALVMVPSTAWLLREKRGMKTVGVVLFFVSFFGVLACRHRFNTQPYPVYLGRISGEMVVHLAAQYLKTFLCLLLLIFPISLILLRKKSTWTHAVWFRIALGAPVLASIAFILWQKKAIDGWMLPWLVPVLPEQWHLLGEMSGSTGTVITISARALGSLLVIAPMVSLAEEFAIRKTWSSSSLKRFLSNDIVLILFPFFVCYLLLLGSAGTYNMIQDRYVLGLVPVAIVVVASLCQRLKASRPPIHSFLILILMAAVSIAGTHDLYSGSRALATEIRNVENSGVPKNHLQASLTALGWARDGWIQLEYAGRMSNRRERLAYIASHSGSAGLNLPLQCTSWFAPKTPAIIPQYTMVSFLRPCFAQTNFSPVHYTTWLPPFHRAIYVQKLKRDAVLAYP